MEIGINLPHCTAINVDTQSNATDAGNSFPNQRRQFTVKWGRENGINLSNHVSTCVN